MVAFISWYIIITLLGWLTFPLVYLLFPALADRGYSLSRAAGLLLWGYLFWLFNSIGLSQNNAGGVLFGLLLVAAVSLSTFFIRGSNFETLEIGDHRLAEGQDPPCAVRRGAIPAGLRPSGPAARRQP